MEPSTPVSKMRCHYEVMEVPMNASIEDIKKQYKKLALRWHPDRNHGNEEQATQIFKEISTAYTVLSDPQERKWYDDHRESILRGGDGTANDDFEGQTVNVWKYFNAGCYDGYSDSKEGFFSVYDGIFRKIFEQEADGTVFMSFGNSNSANSEVFSFYNYWENFVTKLSFAWEDKYNVLDAPNRQVRRAIEKENQKYRDAGKKEYTAEIRSLAAFVKRRDPRIAAIEEETKRKKQEAEEKKQAAKALEQQRRKEQREKWQEESESNKEEQELRDNERKRAFLLADNDSDEDIQQVNDMREEEQELQDNLAKLKLAAAEVALQVEGEGADEEGQAFSEFGCEICSKSFKSEQQLNQHLASKVHRKKAQELTKKTKKAK